MSGPATGSLLLMLQALPAVLRSWRWQHTALGLGLGLFNIALGPGGGLLLWPMPAASKGYGLALWMNFTMFGLPMVLAARCADRAVAQGSPAWKAYTLAVLAVAAGGSALGSALGWSVWGGQPANTMRSAWLAVGIATLYGLGTAAYVLRQRRQAALAQWHAAEAQRARQARDVQLQRLQALQAQVDPQLLFEALGRVETLASTRPRAAQALLEDLISLLRALLPDSARPGSCVERELALLRAQAAVQALPPPVIDVQTASLRCTLAPMLLLPMLEAWRRHVPAATPPALAVTRQSDGSLLLRLAPATGASLPALPAVPEPALAPLRERLNALHGDTARLQSNPGAVLALQLPTHDDDRVDR